MKSKIKNILIIIVIIVGITGAWFAKNKGTNQLEIDDDNVIGQNEVKQENKILIEDIAENNEEEKDVTEVIENNNEEEKQDEVIEENISNEIDKNDPNFDLANPSFDIKTLTAYELPILLDFGAQWCGPCQMMHPILKELNSELRGKAIVKYVDVDEYPEAIKDFNFTLIPTQFFVTKDGDIYKTHTGVLAKEDAIKILKEMGMEE